MINPAYRTNHFCSSFNVANLTSFSKTTKFFEECQFINYKHYYIEHISEVSSLFTSVFVYMRFPLIFLITIVAIFDYI